MIHLRLATQATALLRHIFGIGIPIVGLHAHDLAVFHQRVIDAASRAIQAEAAIGLPLALVFQSRSRGIVAARICHLRLRSASHQLSKRRHRGGRTGPLQEAATVSPCFCWEAATGFMRCARNVFSPPCSSSFLSLRRTSWPHSRRSLSVRGARGSARPSKSSRRGNS